MAMLRGVVDFGPDDDPALDSHIESAVKYEGYIERQAREVRALRDLEARPIPAGFAFDRIAGLSAEARQKLSEKRPETVGQASRIAGVRAADLSILVVHLERGRRTTAGNGNGPDESRRTA
jgi:tRNA uridine 5-carboxymethylaminomethyl modification enzyme